MDKIRIGVINQLRMEEINKLDNLIVEWTERGDMLGIDFSEQIKEMEYLKSVTQPKIYLRQQESEDGVLEIETVLGSQEIQNIIITEI